jgi:hypothetical protein
MWLHLSEEECRQVGEFAKQDGERAAHVSDLIFPGATTPSDDPLIDVATTETEQPLETPSVSQTPVSGATSPPAPTRSPSPPAPTGSLFQSLATSDSDTDSESEEEPDITQVNQTWATLSVELDTMRMLAGASQGKVKGGKKGKQNRAVMETPEMVKLKAKISKLEKDYMFSKKDAGKSPVASCVHGNRLTGRHPFQSTQIEARHGGLGRKTQGDRCKICSSSICRIIRYGTHYRNRHWSIDVKCLSYGQRR